MNKITFEQTPIENHSKTALFSVDTISFYIKSIKPDISPLKLQKTLYFLFAYFSALYSQEEEEGTFEGSPFTDVWLFSACFEPWTYGPVIREVFEKNKDLFYENPEKIRGAIEEVEKNSEVKQFINELCSEVHSVSDFTLVGRCHADQEWNNAYRERRLMNNEWIVAEYIERYVEAIE